MSTISFVLMIVAMMAVLGVLAAGVFGMARGGDFNKKYGNNLMRARVILQGAALLLFALAALTFKK
jgi:hypothetical protein